jgi:hypothetical protein
MHIKLVVLVVSQPKQKKTDWWCTRTAFEDLGQREQKQQNSGDGYLIRGFILNSNQIL